MPVTLYGILAFCHSLIHAVFSFLVAHKMVRIKIPGIFDLMRYGGWYFLPPCCAMCESSPFSSCYRPPLPEDSYTLFLLQSVFMYLLILETPVSPQYC